MSRSVLLISPWLGALASCVAAAGAVASDLTVSGRLSQTVELNDNYSLSTPKSGVLGAYSTGSFNALYRTPATRFSFGGDIVYRKLFGPGAELSSFSETTNDGLNLRIDNRGNALGDNNYFTASRRRTDSSLVQRDEFGFSTTSVKSNLITNSAGGGISRRLSDQDVVNLSATIRNTSYEPSSDTTTPLTSYGASIGWSHSATRTIDLRVSSNANYSVFDNTANTRTLLSTTTGGATIRLSDRLTIGGNAGVTVIKTTQDVAGPVVIVPDITDPLNTPFFTPAPAVAGTVVGPTFDANLNYRLLKDTSFNFTASQGVTQGLLGDITSRTAFTAGINHTINGHSSLSANATLSTLDPPAGGTGSTIFLVSTSYSYSLSRDWVATASYIYRQIENTSSSTSVSTGTSASSNAVLFVLSKGFVLQP